MTRTSFELEIKATTAASAKSLSEVLIADYMGISQEKVSELVELEYRVKSSPESGLIVTVYGSLKRNILNL